MTFSELRRFLAAIVVFVASAGVLRAQSSMGSISGIVTDPTGAVVAGVSIKVTDLDRNVSFPAVTNETGFYMIAPLPPGAYRITAESKGFRTHMVERLPLSTQQKASVNITLQLGEVTESVRVSGGTQLVEPNSSTLSSVVENKRILDLPLNGRNVYSLAFLVPGVSNEALGEEWWQGNRFAINGGRETTNALFFDGVAVDVSFQGPGASGVSITPSVEAVQEFRIQTNSYSAEYGRSGGGVVTMVSKSGTNELHGSLFNFLRNSALDANSFFANRAGRPLASFKRNDFGGSAGGPVSLPRLYRGRDRTFFFLSYEGRRLRSGGLLQQTMPTELERNGDFSRTLNAAGQMKVVYDPFSTRPDPARPGRFIRDPLAGNRIPGSRIDAVAQKAQAYYPRPNAPGQPFTGQLNYVMVTSSRTANDSGTAKIDHFLNERQRFFVRYAIKNSQSDQPDAWGAKNPACVGGCWSQKDRQQNAALDYTHTISSATLLNVRYGVGRAILDRAVWSVGFASTSLGLPAYLDPVIDMPTFPNFTIQDYTGLGLEQGIPYKTAAMTHSVMGNLTKVTGRHTIKTGVDTRFNFINTFQFGSPPPAFNFTTAMTQGPDARTPGAAAGVGYASFLFGAGASGNMQQNVRSATANPYFGFYIQEDYKVNRQLTLNIGLRWDLEIGETERFDRLAIFDPSVQLPLSREVGMDLRGGFLFPGKGMNGRRLVDPYYKALNPRFGFAYQMTPKTVIRSGYGVFFATPAWNASGRIATPFNSSTNWVASLDGVTPYRFMRDPFPDGFNLPEGSSRGVLAGFGQTSANAFIPETLKPPPYNQQWNLSIQRAIAKDTVAEVAYAGNKGTHLPFEFPTYQLNQLRPELLSMGDRLLELVPNPFYGYVQSGTLAQPQVQRGQLLRPYPQYQSVQHSNVGWGNSNYHALQTRLEKRFSDGWSLMVSYGWSKTISDGHDGLWMRNFSLRNYHCRTCERSVSSLEPAHNLVTNFTAELPVGKGKQLGGSWNAWVDALLGQWQVNGILTLASGRPLVFGIDQNTSFSLGGGQHPDSTGKNADLGSARSIDRWFDTAQFTRPAPFTFGNVGRTHPNLRQDSTQNVDLSIFKNFRVKERARVQFRAEAFNFANHAQFAAPNTTYGAPLFGIVSGQANAPRQLQFALKVLF